MHCIAERKGSVSMINRIFTNVSDFIKMDGSKDHMDSCFCGCHRVRDSHSIVHAPD